MAVKWEREREVQDEIVGLNHLTTTGSGFINPLSGRASLHSCLTPLPPSSAGEHNHMQPSAHVGAHVGELVFGSVWGRYVGGGKLQIQLGDFPIMIIHFDDHTLLDFCFVFFKATWHP